MISVFTDKEVTVKFNVNIEGNKNLPEGRLLLNLDSGCSLSIKAKIEDKIAKVTIPPLKYLLKETNNKVLSAVFEVLADDKYFTPWKDTCELKESMQVNIKEDVLTEEKTETITIEAEIEEEKKEKKVIKLFKDSTLKPLLINQWNKLKKLNDSKDININTSYHKGYFDLVDQLIKKIKESQESITEEEVHSLMKNYLKEAIDIKEKNIGLDKHKKEYSEGYYSGILETMLLQ